MRTVEQAQFRLGQLRIEDIKLDAKSRDDIPALLRGLQHIYKNEKTRSELFALLEAHICPGVDRSVGRPGMNMWKILVLGILKQGLGCDFDRLHELANQHKTVRQMMGHGDFADDAYYEYQTVIDNISLLTPELLAEVGKLVVKTGHEVAKKNLGAPLRCRCDSFVVETNVHYPTDLNLLWDAMRCLIRETGKAARKFEVGGWRQSEQLSRKVHKLFNRVRGRRKRQEKDVRAYLGYCGPLVDRAEETIPELREKGALQGKIEEIECFIRHARRQIDQVYRRLLRGETIPQEEKVFSIFEEHTRWIQKGKAGVPVELGVPVCIIEDQHQFILDYKILWEGGDTDIAVSMIHNAQKKYPELRACSFDRGFHSPSNRSELDEMLDLNALPRKGKLSRIEREREEAEDFKFARRQHPAVESAINNLEQRGLDRVRTRGADGFSRTVALSILALNLHWVAATGAAATATRSLISLPDCSVPSRAIGFPCSKS